MLPLPPLAAAYLLFLAFVCGACAGSFTNCAALRHVTGEKVSRGRSHCPQCGHTLGILDLFPIFSWVFLRGKCRYCGAPVSKRYPFTELICALLWLSSAAVCGLSVQTLEYCVLFTLLLAVALIDYDTMEIPDGLLLAGAALFAACLFFHDAPLARLKSGLLGGLALGGSLLVISLVMDKVLGRDSMGGGDIKLFALLGLYTGLGVGLLLVILSCFAGLLFAFLSKAKDKPFPFGPAIALAAWPALLVGPRFVNWYLSLF